MEREIMEYDVVIVGAGPSGLECGDPAEAAGIRTGARDIGVRPGKGLGSGRAPALGRRAGTARPDELIPDWKEKERRSIRRRRRTTSST